MAKDNIKQTKLTESQEKISIHHPNLKARKKQAHSRNTDLMLWSDNP